ncbi:hNH endonuclease [Enterobacter ludwigii]|uniref:hNH endonuclease n=1 Tax=Enterobacter ludwigii TaxID=299767 RepID=UPI003ED9C4F3
MSNKYEDLIKNARVNAECGEHMSPEEVTTLLNVVETTFAALAAENAWLKGTLSAVIDRSNEPDYQSIGMGCGVEDNGLQTDGYNACEYGWLEAMDRIYSEVIPDTIPETPATDAFLAEVRAQGVDALVERRLTAARLAKEAGHEITARDLEGEAIRGRFFAVEIRKGVHS